MRLAYAMLAIVIVLASVSGCKGVMQSDAPQIHQQVEAAAEDVGDAGQSIAATTQPIGDAVAQGEAITAKVTDPKIREALYAIWGAIREKLGSLTRTAEQVTKLQDRLVNQGKQVGTLEQTLADKEKTIREKDQVIAGLKASTSKEAEKASAWGVVAGGGLVASGIVLMIVTQSLLGRALAIGGIVLSVVMMLIVQLFRAGDAIAPLMPWAFGVAIAMLLGWLAWEIWRKRTKEAAYAVGLEKRAATAVDADEAEILRDKAAAVWRAIDAGYDRLMAGGKQK